MPVKAQRVDSRWFFLSVILFIAGGFGLLAGKVWLAEHWNDLPDPKMWEKAAELEPGNASYWLHLGIYHEAALFPPDERRALEEFRKAALANPNSAGVWLHIARASEDLGDPAAARAAYQTAQLCHPISAVVAWRYGSFLIRQADLPEAYPQIRRSVQADPSLTLSAISQFWEAGEDARQILDGLKPARTSVYFTALEFFSSQRLVDAALAVWQRMLDLHLNLDMQQVLPLVNELIRQDRLAEAVRAWHEALQAANWPADSQSGGSLIFDGGFEHDLLNGGFAWRENPTVGAQYSFDSRVTHSGARALRVTFDGSANLDFAQIQQYVIVEPARRYRFSAFLRTEGITTENGVGFEVEDARDPHALNQFTPALTDNHSWTAVDVEFVTGSATRLLLISLRRKPSQRLDSKLGGTVWVDDVTLVPLSASGKP
jgi:tetratricopeptide (TPR) repeat protein